MVLKEKGKMEKLMQFFKDEEGVTAIEYSLIAALIAVVIILMVMATGEAVSEVFSKVSSALDAA
jgi:pilus assembly protein Flp/PilA